MISKILAKRYAESKKHPISTVIPGELIIVPIENDHTDEDEKSDFYYRIVMVIRQEQRYTIVHSVGVDDVETDNSDVYINKTVQVVWLVESFYPIRRAE